MYRIGIDLGGTNIAAGVVDDVLRLVHHTGGALRVRGHRLAGHLRQPPGRGGTGL